MLTMTYFKNFIFDGLEEKSRNLVLDNVICLWQKIENFRAKTNIKLK